MWRSWPPFNQLGCQHPILVHRLQRCKIVILPPVRELFPSIPEAHRSFTFFPSSIRTPKAQQGITKKKSPQLAYFGKRSGARRWGCPQLPDPECPQLTKPSAHDTWTSLSLSSRYPSSTPKNCLPPSVRTPDRVTGPDSSSRSLRHADGPEHSPSHEPPPADRRAPREQRVTVTDTSWPSSPTRVQRPDPYSGPVRPSLDLRGPAQPVSTSPLAAIRSVQQRPSLIAARPSSLGPVRPSLITARPNSPGKFLTFFFIFFIYRITHQLPELGSGDSFSRASVARPREGGHSQAALQLGGRMRAPTG
ncbi:hypothetical protein CRG98_033797 [Punica granatum]|uniref:Uncharacterized protein n=1 Tax=Punica granatum TaxID=22663 RepID=A0A2I0IQ60_PUNGR|nr:hypothetical protein CRG98_033797 [Punica granatum]